MKRFVNKFAGMQVFRSAGRPRLLPVSVAYSLTHKCNSKCKTCGLWKCGEPAAEELDTAEWLKVFKALGSSPAWITVTGGEPFLRDDLMELLRGMVEASRPKYMTVVTNGFFTSRASLMLPLLARECPGTRFFANISLDGIGAGHDRIRGLPGSFDAAMDTFHALRRNQPRNLYVGFHTTISKHNAAAVKDLAIYAKGFNPDAHGFEIAQQRAELRNSGFDTDPAFFRELLPDLVEGVRSYTGAGTTRKTRAIMREMYYRTALERMEKKRQAPPCFAGFASAQISPLGEVWNCCVRCDVMGNMRESDFDFSKIWKSAEADKARAHVSDGKCWCTMANAIITSLMYSTAGVYTMSGKFLLDAIGLSGE